MERGRHVRFLWDGRGLYPGGGSPFNLDIAPLRFCRPTMFVIRPTMFVIGIVAVPSVICTRYALGLLNEEDSAIRMETLFQPWTRWFLRRIRESVDDNVFARQGLLALKLLPWDAALARNFARNYEHGCKMFSFNLLGQKAAVSWNWIIHVNPGENRKEICIMRKNICNKRCKLVLCDINNLQ